METEPHDRNLMLEYAIRLEAIGQFQNDQACNATETGTLFIQSARMLRDYSDFLKLKDAAIAAATPPEAKP